MSDKDQNLVTVTIDGQTLRVPKGTNMIEAAKKIKREIPHYCYHPKLSVVGNCRMCLVEMGMTAKDRETGEVVLDEVGGPKVNWMSKPAIACSTNATDGLHIRTDSELVKECQKGVMEFLLINHPLDCPICDQAGECHLQEFATDYGRGYSRFVENKVVKPKRTRLGPRVMLDDERCILCSRCIRFSKEIVHDDVLGFVDHGSHSTLTCYPGKELNNNYSLNTVDICPVGALTSTDFRFKMRVWFLKAVDSICVESSVGANTQVWSREGKIYRITPRRNDEVNDTWMSDSGRELYKLVEAENRLKTFRVDGGKVSPLRAIETAGSLIKHGKTAYVVSGFSSVEEQYLLAKVVKKRPGPIYFVGKIGDGDGLLISADHRPNIRGLLATGLIDSLGQGCVHEIRALIDRGEVDTLVFVHDNPEDLNLTEEQRKKVRIIYFGTHSYPEIERANVIAPILSVFERTGTFINQQYRLQKFFQAIPGPAGTLPNIQLFARLYSVLANEEFEAPTIDSIWQEMSQELPIFKDIQFSQIPSTGVLLDDTHIPEQEFPYVEGKSLHFDPRLRLLEHQKRLKEKSE